MPDALGICGTMYKVKIEENLFFWKIWLPSQNARTRVRLLYNEEYSDCVMGWVEKGRMKSIEKRCISTQENQFFHLWNEFILGYGYVGAIGRIHMSRVLERFIEERGKQVIQENLYKQFVSHVVMLESEAVLLKGQMLRLAVNVGIFYILCTSVG